MRNNQITRVLVFEPSEIVQHGLRSLLSSEDLQIVGFLRDLEDWKEQIHYHTPDVLLINPNICGWPVSKQLERIQNAYPELILLGLQYSFFAENDLKLFQDIIFISDEKASILKKINTPKEDTNKPVDKQDGEDLSDREREILVSVVQGLSNKEIAENHHISIHTVISHRKNITRKTGIKSVSGLTIYALINNMIDYPG